ncbi:MAG: glutamate ligase domain-containing protein, partial [Pararhizobium sp.]
ALAGGGSFVLIDESYNANPTSMRAALDLLADTPVAPGGRRIAVLGDMLELGRFSEDLHRELAGPIAGAGVDRLYLVGAEMRALATALAGERHVEHFPDAAAVADRLKGDIAPGDAVVVKSSLGIGFGAVVSELLKAFPAAGSTAPAVEAAPKGS